MFERGSEEHVLLLRPDRDADRLGGAEPGERADDHALAEQLLEDFTAVADLDIDEIAERRACLHIDFRDAAVLELQIRRLEARAPGAFSAFFASRLVFGVNGLYGTDSDLPPNTLYIGRAAASY